MVTVTRWWERWKVAVVFLMVTGMSVWGLATLENANDTAQEAIESADLRTKIAFDRISGLLAQIDMLRADLAQARADRAVIEAKIDALAAQVEQLGGKPVARSNPTPAPTTPTTQPNEKKCTLKIVGNCL